MRIAAACCALVTIAAMSGCDGADATPPAPKPVHAAPIPQVSAPRPAIEFTTEELTAILRLSPLPPPPPDPTNAYADNEQAAHLGHRLYFDPGLSANGQVSCATCHDPIRSFSDPKPLARGIGEGDRHAMTLVNVAHNSWFNWDGRADTLWAQALRPLEKDNEMGSTRAAIAAYIAGHPHLRTSYESVFGALPGERGQEQIDRLFANIGKVLAAYQRRVVYGDAPFDRFVAGLRGEADGDIRAISRDAQLGLKLFIGRGNCIACHAGANFTDGAFHSVRIAPLEGEPKDAGRFEGVAQVKADPFNAASVFSDDRTSGTAKRLEFITRTSADWGRFKTPTLRNVAITPPYMHQGQKTTLRDVLHHYSTFEGALPPGHDALDGQEQLLRPLALTDAEVEQLLAFLESLTSLPRDRSWVTPPP